MRCYVVHLGSSLLNIHKHSPLQKRERIGKDMVVFRLVGKLRFLNERSDKFESLKQE